MMAGAGVGGVGGAGMLRTRRRDVSVKPNRKLDRKSSRGMIYENEELRLRTIHINAEVEQGQNDIKKLRRENEQLRREIWSLRDEYDKLEEILKKQKNHDESEEYEDRSEEDDSPQSDFSCDEDEDNEKTAKDFNQEEQLENAENQKISSEKMSSSLHRLHVEFDDLSVVDEEEEPKRDKERKDATPSDEVQRNEAARHPPPPILGPRQLHDNIPFYPATYEPTSSFSGTSYYTECPFEFPSTVDLMLAADTSALLVSPCSGLQSDPLIPPAGLNTDLDRVADPMLPQIHVPPVGWQNDVVSQKQLPIYTGTSVAPIASVTRMQMMGKPDSHPEYQKMIPSLGNSISSDAFSLSRIRNASTRQPAKFQAMSAIQDSRTQLSNYEEVLGKNIWNVTANFTDKKQAMTNGEKNVQNSRIKNQNTEETTVLEKPKHFFAPLPFKLKKQEEESPTASMSHFGTGTSSSSGKTASTVISRTNPFVAQKGSADIYVNGAIPYEDENKNDSKTFLSTDNLLIADNRSAPSNQLTKSVSCQNLSSESQSIAEELKLNHVESQMFTKSDNALDNITNNSSGKPYKSHLNVTLKVPRVEQTPSPETPEVPNLPSIDYRFFRNPFLRNFDKICPSYQVEPKPPSTTTPLSIQVNDDGFAYQYPPAYGRGVHFNEKFRTTHLPDQNRLLIPGDQLMSGKQDIQVTSFEKPSPCTLIPPATPYDLTTLRRLNANRYLQSQNLYQNVPFIPRGQFYPRRSEMLHYDNVATKVPAQTQTSLDGDSHHEDEETISVPNSPDGERRKKIAKRDKILVKDQRPLSPAAQRRLKKQSSATSTDTLDSPGKMTRKKPRKLSTMTISDAQEDKNESRSSSSGQDSPRKDQNRRISAYINSKRRPSQTSLKTSRSGSVDASKDKYTDSAAPNLERERTNSVSSREIANVKARKTSTSSGNVPWCACWGNGCI
ncbi:microtubule-associated protein futsch-like isoform x1 protein [Lasius niger]|uniref:Microtubule-associated protein futsch-like isoform x1 protein n=1 Tax=Lasius niger TaxID=67767 RepID=A0A0J7P5C7_LASNI|nr:microtubule-associated protein futsch-like isoform x1 protein [Lasius niger]